MFPPWFIILGGILGGYASRRQVRRGHSCWQAWRASLELGLILAAVGFVVFGAMELGGLG